MEHYRNCGGLRRTSAYYGSSKKNISINSLHSQTRKNDTVVHNNKRAYPPTQLPHYTETQQCDSKSGSVSHYISVAVARSFDCGCGGGVHHTQEDGSLHPRIEGCWQVHGRDPWCGDSIVLGWHIQLALGLLPSEIGEEQKISLIKMKLTKGAATWAQAVTEKAHKNNANTFLDVLRGTFITPQDRQQAED